MYVDAIPTDRPRQRDVAAGRISRVDRINSGPDIALNAPAPELRIGPRLRRARLANRFTLDDVARATGLTKGFISQLERDMTSASVASLVKVCDALRISVGALFEPPTTSVTRSQGASRINFGGKGLVEALLTPSSSGDLQVIRSVIDPGGGSGDEPYSLDAKSEVLHVLEGEVLVNVDSVDYRLSEGDTLTFSAKEPHAWHNPSKRRRAVALWILAPSPW
jgi:transcriptional regulator with XRE-family HTH domain